MQSAELCLVGLNHLSTCKQSVIELNVSRCHISDPRSTCTSLGAALLSSIAAIKAGPVWAVGVTMGGSATATALEVSMGFPFFIPHAWEAELSVEESRGEPWRWQRVRKEGLGLPECCILSLF